MKSNDFVSSRFFDFYDNVDYATYQKEKKRLQVELLKELDAVAQCKSVLGGD